MTGWLMGAFFAAGIALVLLADIASSLHAIATHLAEYRMDGMKRELRATGSHPAAEGGE